jgi:hypothetical protein
LKIFTLLEIVLTISWIMIFIFDSSRSSVGEFKSERIFWGLLICLLTLILLFGSPFLFKRSRILGWAGLILSLGSRLVKRVNFEIF